MEGTFTIQEAANIMDCKKSWIYELLADGWLCKPPDGTEKKKGGQVTQKSLFQFMVVDRLSRMPKRTLKMLKNNYQQFEKIFSTNAEASCLFTNEGTSKEDGDLSAVNPE